MGFQTFTAKMSVATDADFRAWGSAIAAAIVAAGGWVKTSDTGQINWTTVLTGTGSGGQVMGYEVYRLNDSLNATFPLYLRVKFGSATNGTGTIDKSTPRMWLTLGKGSDGAGGITAPFFTDLVVGPQINNITTGTPPDSLQRDCYVTTGPGAGGDSMLAVLPFHGFVMGAAGYIGPPPAFIIERSRDSEGVATGDGVSVAFTYSTASNTSVNTLNTTLSASIPLTVLWNINYASGQINKGRIPVTVPRDLNGVLLGGGGSLALAAIAPCFPWTCYAPNVPPWQMVGALSWTDDPGGVFTVRISGEDRLFRSLPLHNSYCGWGVGEDGTKAAGGPLQSTYVGLAVAWAA